MIRQRFFSDQWTRVNLVHYIANDGPTRLIVANWWESVPNRMSMFLFFSPPTDCVFLMVSGEILQCKLYEANGTEIARESRGLITKRVLREALPREIVPFEYPYDIAWHDQLSIKLKDNLEIILPSDCPAVLFEPGCDLVFNILSTSTIPYEHHADTKFSYHVYLFNESYARYIELRASGRLRLPVKIQDTFQEAEKIK